MYKRVLVALGASMVGCGCRSRSRSRSHTGVWPCVWLCVDSGRVRSSLPVLSTAKNTLALAEARAAATGVTYEAHLAYGNIV